MHELRARLQGRGPKLIVDKPANRVAGADSAFGVDLIRRSESRLNDNRSEGRQRLEEEEILVESEGRSVPLKLINLSEGGAMLEGEFQLTLFSHVFLLLPGNQRVACVVRWLKDNRAGVEFEAGTSVQQSDEDHGELVRSVIARSFPGFDLSQLRPWASRSGLPERAPRAPLTWMAMLLHDYRSSQVRIRNISATGALVECTDDFRPGAEVVLDLGRAGSMDSVVVWSFGDQIGLRFDEPFDLTLLKQSMPRVAAGAEGEFVDFDQLTETELQSFLEGFLKY